MLFRSVSQSRYNGTIYWADTKEELIDRFGKDHEPKSVTYIRYTIYDNPILLETDPSYIASLKALNYVDRMRLLGVHIMLLSLNTSTPSSFKFK